MRQLDPRFAILVDQLLYLRRLELDIRILRLVARVGDLATFHQQKVARLDEPYGVPALLGPILISSRPSLFRTGCADDCRHRFPDPVRGRIDNRVHDVLDRGRGSQLRCLLGWRLWRSTARDDEENRHAHHEKPKKP
jgi:hypothetical protein